MGQNGAIAGLSPAVGLPELPPGGHIELPEDAREVTLLGWASLSPTEANVVELVGDGLTNREIAEQLFMSPRTVQGHLSRIFRKLDVASRRELREAYRRR
jgi:DNA-binding CsgD family transcriptional regulator